MFIVSNQFTNNDVFKSMLGSTAYLLDAAFDHSFPPGVPEALWVIIFVTVILVLALQAIV